MAVMSSSWRALAQSIEEPRVCMDHRSHYYCRSRWRWFVMDFDMPNFFRYRSIPCHVTSYLRYHQLKLNTSSTRWLLHLSSSLLEQTCVYWLGSVSAAAIDEICHRSRSRSSSGRWLSEPWPQLSKMAGWTRLKAWTVCTFQPATLW